MNGEYTSQYLQNNGNSPFTGAVSQQMNLNYETQQHHSTLPWMGSDQQLALNHSMISGATVTPPTTLNASNVVTTPSKPLYHASSSETNNNFVQAPVVGSNVRKPITIKQESNAITNADTPVTTIGGLNNNRSPEYVDYTQKCVQVILEINYELIRVCIDYQSNGLVNEPDLVLYKARLQGNLSYLATVADEYNGNPRNEIKPKLIPDLSSLPIPRSNFGQKINTLFQRAVQIFAQNKKYHRANPANTSTINNNVSSINNISSTSSSQMLDASSPSSRQLKQQQLISPPQQPHTPQQTQQQQQKSSQPQQTQTQLLQQQTTQQLHQQQQQNPQQSSNRFTNSMIPTVTIATAYQQQHTNSQHQNMVATSSMSDYSIINATNSEQSYQVSLPPLGNISIGNTGVGNGGNGNAQGSGILPSIAGTGAGGISGTGFGPANNFSMMRYPSSGGNGMGNSLASTVLGGGNSLSNSLGNNNIGINAIGSNSYGSNTIAGNTLGLPSMMNHDNSMG
ncbi:14194_t:CDS:2 [Funneliformis geosporum]|uniref:7043_t:CDS:1 n=1 Tax=Funneliformis geosporum TaxID=1117311 RepID=A0A9W4SYA6_9GLOM|nr:14194_t:CDS:2 [Funneliformis geosporum]CAI2183509.1 7043_t:CDS:2 [Funneliformis geosporum]